MPYVAPTEYMPDVAIPPGATIRETLRSIGMTQTELAERMGRPESKVSEIVKGTKAITVGTAIALERVLPFPADFWLNLEKNYRLALARLKEAEVLERDIQWMRDTIPVNELVKRTLIPKTSDLLARLQAVLSFFGTGSVPAWKEYWERRIVAAVSFRRSQKQANHIGRVATWLRLGELDAQRKPCQSFNKRRFQAALRGIRSATVEPREVFEPLLEELTECGVVVSLVKEIPGAGISGATRWLGANKAHIQLSFRYKTDDQFWFTFFHEAGHVLLHGREDVFLEDTSGAAPTAKESEADEFAANFLIPPTQATKLPGIRNRQQVVDFASQLGIAPGIVAGRLQHDEYFSPKTVNYWKVKRKLAWCE